jgi:hypothetical protein
MNNLWYRLPLALKCALPVFLLVLVAALVLVTAQEWNQRRWLQHHADAFGEALSASLAQNAARALVQDDPVLLQAVLAEFAGDPLVQRAAVYDQQQRLVAAAGEANPHSWDYSATIQWEAAAVGGAVLSLRPTIDAGLLTLRDRIGLALLLALAAGVIALRAGGRVENLINRLARRFRGEDVAITYRGNDALGRLLQAPLPPLLEPDPEVAAPASCILLQIYTPDESAAAGEQALALARTVCQLYGGSAEVTRAGGITARFPDTDAEAPFRALCGAQLLQRMSRGNGYRLALAPLSAKAAASPWLEQAALRDLDRGCVVLAAGEELLVDDVLRQQPAIAERCELEPVDGFWRVSALRSPYDALLERQYHTLNQELAID